MVMTVVFLKIIIWDLWEGTGKSRDDKPTLDTNLPTTWVMQRTFLVGKFVSMQELWLSFEITKSISKY